MNYYYTPDLLSTPIEVKGDEFRHSIKSMRLKPGDNIILVDGKGTHVVARIEQLMKDKMLCLPVTVETNYHPLKYQLTLAVAPTKNLNRYEWMIEKATEIGTSYIVPLICQRSERRKIRSERLNKIMLSAMKQSLKAYAPILSDLQPFDKFIEGSIDRSSTKYICSGQAKDHLLDVINEHHSIELLVGPEGDFSNDEMELATKNGYIPVHLGNQRLRTETAAIMACSLVSSYFDRVNL